MHTHLCAHLLLSFSFLLSAKREYLRCLSGISQVAFPPTITRIIVYYHLRTILYVWGGIFIAPSVQGWTRILWLLFSCTCLSTPKIFLQWKSCLFVQVRLPSWKWHQFTYQAAVSWLSSYKDVRVLFCFCRVHTHRVESHTFNMHIFNWKWICSHGWLILLVLIKIPSEGLRTTVPVEGFQLCLSKFGVLETFP